MARKLALLLSTFAAVGMVAAFLHEKPVVEAAPAPGKDALPAAANTTVQEAGKVETSILPAVELPAVELPAVEPPAPAPPISLRHPGYASLHERYASEPVDKPWASRVEADVHQRLPGFGSAYGYELVDASIHCRTTICRLDLVVTSNPAADSQQPLSEAISRGLTRPLLASDDRLNRMTGSAGNGQATFYLYKSDLFAERSMVGNPEGRTPPGWVVPWEEAMNLTPDQLSERIRADTPGAFMR